MTGIREAHSVNLSSASQWSSGPQSRRPRYIKYPPIRRKWDPVPPGWVQDNREKSGLENLGGDAQAMEGDQVKTAHSPWPRAPPLNSRPRLHGGRRPPVQRGGEERQILSKKTRV